jgi:hypothetical protein
MGSEVRVSSATTVGFVISGAFKLTPPMVRASTGRASDQNVPGDHPAFGPGNSTQQHQPQDGQHINGEALVNSNELGHSRAPVALIPAHLSPC